MQESLHLYVVLVLECWKVERCVPGPSLSPGELQHNASFTNQCHLCSCIYYSLPACYPEAVLWLLLLSQSPQVCTLHDFVGVLYNCVVNILSPCRLPNHTHRAVWNGTSTSHRPPPFGVPPFWGEVSTRLANQGKKPSHQVTPWCCPAGSTCSSAPCSPAPGNGRNQQGVPQLQNADSCYWPSFATSAPAILPLSEATPGRPSNGRSLAGEGQRPDGAEARSR